MRIFGFQTKVMRRRPAVRLQNNGVVRILAAKYPNSPGSPAIVAGIVEQLRSLPGHSFWTEDFSLVGSDAIDASHALTSARVTDTYLLALARLRGGQLATFDRRLSVDAVKDGKATLHLSPSA